MSCPRYVVLRFKDLRANSVDPDEAAHNEPPLLYLYCLQIQLVLAHLYKSMGSYLSGKLACMQTGLVIYGLSEVLSELNFQKFNQDSLTLPSGLVIGVNRH